MIPRVLKTRRSFFWSGFLVILSACNFGAISGNFDVFGPNDYVREKGPPAEFQELFAVLNPDTRYIMTVHNGGQPLEKF